MIPRFNNLLYLSGIVHQNSHLHSRRDLQRNSQVQRPLGITPELQDNKIMSHPSLDLTLTPIFNSTTEAAESLDIKLEIQSPDVDAGEPLLWIANKIGNWDTQRYDEGPRGLVVTDDDGELKLEIKDEKTLRTWFPNRKTKGNVVVKCNAIPRVVYPTTPMGPRSDMRAEYGGLVTGGESIIPAPVEKDELHKATWRASVTWDLSSAPKGTRGVWSFGEGPQTVYKTGESNVIYNTVYMVGPIKSHPPAPSPDGSDHYGFYWLTPLPEKFKNLPEDNMKIFEGQSKFFADPPSPDNPYRTFARYVGSNQGYGGSAFVRSYVLEYDDRIDTVETVQTFILLSHELVHEWGHLNEYVGTPKAADADVGWYVEGIAMLYQSLVPYRYGLLSEDEFVSDWNGTLMKYYTSKYKNIPAKEAKDRGMEDMDTFELQYNRGMTYLLQVDSMIRKATGGKRSFDDLQMDIIKRERARGKLGDYGEEDFIKMFGDEIGDHEKAKKVHQDHLDGKNIVPPEDCLKGFKLLKTEQEQFERGFDITSLAAGKISGVIKGSRAWEAGLRDGDIPVRWSYGSILMEDINAKMVMSVKRDSKDMTFTYRPRTWEKVESYQFVKA